MFLIGLVVALLSVIAVPSLAVAQSTQEQSAVTEKAAYQDERLPVEARVDDLVRRMTLEEKVSQMKNAAPAANDPAVLTNLRRLILFIG